MVWGLTGIKKPNSSLRRIMAHKNSWCPPNLVVTGPVTWPTKPPTNGRVDIPAVANQKATMTARSQVAEQPLILKENPLWVKKSPEQ